MDGRSLYGYTNHQAVEVLRNTGKVVKLRLARYLRGSKYEQLQQAIATPDPPSPYMSHPIPGSTIIQIYDQSSDLSQINNEIKSFEVNSSDIIKYEFQSEEEAKQKWQSIVGDSFEIVVIFLELLSQICIFA